MYSALQNYMAPLTILLLKPQVVARSRFVGGGEVLFGRKWTFAHEQGMNETQGRI